MPKERLKIFQQLKNNSFNNTTTNSIQPSHDHQKSDSLIQFPVTTLTIFSFPGEIEFLRRNHKNNQDKCQNILTLIYHLQLSPLQHVMKFIKNSKDQHVSQPAQETLDKHH
jgi:hypothetical protein